jgi:hypothetical protein
MTSGLTATTDDDDFERRPQRRRYEEPLAATVRRQLLTIAESVRFNLPFTFHYPALGTAVGKNPDFT